MHFTPLPSSFTQVRLVHTFPAHGAFELLQDQGGGAGVCVGDFDGDGKPDLFFTDYDQGNRLYRNQGDWRFEEIGDAHRLREHCGRFTSRVHLYVWDLELHTILDNLRHRICRARSAFACRINQWIA